MVLAAPQLPEDRRQPAERAAAHAAEGANTMVNDAQGRFCHVKAVAWVRPRAGDVNHWTTKAIPPPPGRAQAPRNALPAAAVSAASTAPTKPHPALVEFQAEAARNEERRQISKAANVEGRTSSSSYGSYYHQRSESAIEAEAAALVNNVGAEQIASQQTRLWGTLDATAKRLGFSVSHAAKGSELAAIEAAQDAARFRTVAQVSFSSEGKDRIPEILVPDSMNRTSCGFPLSPVNQYSSAMQSSTLRRPRKMGGKVALELSKEVQALATGAASASSSHPSSAAAPASPASKASPAKLTRPPVVSASAASSFGRAETSTAHATGYGSKHQFFHHYLSSAPQLD